MDLQQQMDALGIAPIAYGFRDSRVTYKIEYRGAGAWAITDGVSNLNRDGEWEYEPRPSERGQAFFNRCRFPLHEAVTRLAEWRAREDSNPQPQDS